MHTLTAFVSLTQREIHRFLKLWTDTTISPIISTLLFLAIFMVVTGGRDIDGIPYLTFVFSGLIMMNVVTGSFSNPAFALVIAKNLGSIVDLQTAPLPAWLVGLAYALAATFRAIIILTITLLICFWWLPSFHIAHPALALLVLTLSGLQFGTLGVIFGMLASGFESLPIITSFVLQPLIFLGGVFYPISSLPHIFYTLSTWNPIHHNVNLTRYAFLNYSDVTPAISLAILLGSLIPLLIIMGYIMQKKMRA